MYYIYIYAVCYRERVASDTYKYISLLNQVGLNMSNILHRESFVSIRLENWVGQSTSAHHVSGGK